MTHQELIAVLEKATGPSREVDAQIAIAVGIRYRTRKTGGGVSKGREWFEDGHGGVETWVRHPPAYTASIDAAMTLVPEGYSWQIKHGFFYEAIVWSVTVDYDDSWNVVPSSKVQSNAAIALCIAALRARAQTGGGK